MLEKILQQRDQARGDRDRYLSIIAKLVTLRDEPRSVHYSRASMLAWENARAAVTESMRTSPQITRS